MAWSAGGLDGSASAGKATPVTANKFKMSSRCTKIMQLFALAARPKFDGHPPNRRFSTLSIFLSSGVPSRSVLKLA